MPSTRPRTCAVVAAVLLSLTACGSRADSTLRQQAADAALGGTGSGTGTSGDGGSTGTVDGGTTGTAATGTAGTTGTAGSTGGATSGTGSTTGTGSTGASTTGTAGGSGTGSAPAPAGGNGGATDVGVTGTSITVGNVSDISGPRPGLFAGAVTGTQAYFAKINSEGGVFGRQLALKIGDGQLDCGRNKEKTAALVPNVFAFVGSFSLYDDCGASILKDHQDIPDIHNALGAASQKLTSNFSIAPLGGGWRTGPLQYWKAKYGDKWKKVGAIYAGVGTGPAIWANTKAAIEASGGGVAHEESYGATDTDFTSAVVRMQSDGVQLIYVNTTDGPTSAALVRAIKRQNLTWPIIFGATAYAPDFLSNVSKDEAEGVMNDQQFAQFFNADDAAKIPNVAAFQKWMQIADPKQQRDIFAAYGWASAQLFVDALKKAGPKVTRKAVLSALAASGSFDADGMFAPSNPAKKQPATCWMVNVVKNGTFVRVDPTAAKFRCDGTYFVKVS